MPIALNLTAPQRLSNGATVTVAAVPNPPADPGRTVLHAWRIDVSPPGNAQSLNGETILLPWNRAGFSFFQGGNVAAPVPDASWDQLPSALAGGSLTAQLANVPTNPLYIALGQ